MYRNVKWELMISIGKSKIMVFKKGGILSGNNKRNLGEKRQ
jgi:hypothetical protein